MTSMPATCTLCQSMSLKAVQTHGRTHVLWEVLRMRGRTAQVWGKFLTLNSKSQWWHTLGRWCWRAAW